MKGAYDVVMASTSRSRVRLGWLWPGCLAAIACLCFGSAVTIGMAWFLDVVVHDSGKRLDNMTIHFFPRDLSQYGKSVAEVARTEETPGLAWPHTPPPDWPRPDDLVRWRSTGYQVESSITHDLREGEFSQGEWSAGLPMLAVRKRWTNDPNRPPVDGVWHERLSIGNASVPIRPIWPGFAVDVVFWTAVPWASIVVFRVVRARRRVRRGLCAHCRYEVGAFERCPECGA